MTDKQINKQLRREFGSVGWALLVYFLIMNALAICTMVADMLAQLFRLTVAGKSATMLDMDTMAGNAWGYILSLAVGVVILHAWKGGSFWREEVFLREKRMQPKVFLICICLTMGGQMLNSLWLMVLELILNAFDSSMMPMLESVSGTSDTFSMYLYASILGPIAEEVVFRGYVLRSLRPYGKRFAVLCSALLFGLFHGNLLQMLNAFLMGLVMGYLTVEYSIVWAMGLHIFNNMILADLLTRLTSGLSEAAASGISFGLLAVCALASIVILVVKRREVKAYNASEWIDRRCLKCFFTSAGILVMIALMLVLSLSMLGI